MTEHLFLEDDTGDKKYFTIIPNVLIDSSPATALALYLHIKRSCGELPSGLCFLSQKMLCKKLDIEKSTLKKYIKFLLDEKLILFCGEKNINTNGGPQKIKTYRVTNIWKRNIDHYEGGLKSNTPSAKGGLKSFPKGGENTTPKKNRGEEDKSDFSISQEEKEKIMKMHADFKKKMGW